MEQWVCLFSALFFMTKLMEKKNPLCLKVIKPMLNFFFHLAIFSIQSIHNKGSVAVGVVGVHARLRVPECCPVYELDYLSTNSSAVLWVT